MSSSASVNDPQGVLITVASDVLSSPGRFGLFPKLDDDLANRPKLFLQVRDVVLRVSELLHELLVKDVSLSPVPRFAAPHRMKWRNAHLPIHLLCRSGAGECLVGG